MSPTQALTLGYHPFLTTPNRNKKRAWFKNYSQPGIYMITLVVEGRYPIFGTLNTDPAPHVIPTPLGKGILDIERYKINQIYPNVAVYKLCLMPDHIHMILEVTKSFVGKKGLGDVVRGFKYGITKRFRELSGTNYSILEKGYNDRILYGKGQLERWKKYLNDNPLRLALKRSQPELFKIRERRSKDGSICQLIGNHYLLDVPDKEAIIVHRIDSDADYAAKRKQWLECGARGGVLIATGIAPREKEVYHQALKMGYRVIHLVNEPFGELYKPAGDACQACANGNLLEIYIPYPEPYHGKITREHCQWLNVKAQVIAGL